MIVFQHCKLTFVDTELLNAEIWHGSNATFDGNLFHINFNSNNGNYEIILKPITKYNFQGVIICDKKEAGKASMTYFENGERTNWVLVGLWKENGFNYDCVIELKK